MDIKLFDYKLPQNLIANSPIEPRDHSRLLVINRQSKQLKHDNFYNLPKYLTSNDVLVFNNSKVFPARIFGTKSTGGKIELLLLNNTASTRWSAMYKGKLKKGDNLIVNGINLKVGSVKAGIAEIEFDIEPLAQMELIYKIGHTPIPPYIKTDETEFELRKKYQTIYAKIQGSVAAPTAGFHFTKKLLDKLKDKGIQTEFVTLHVGLGTFAPVKEKKLEQHKIHVEYFEVDQNTIARLNKAKHNGKRIICVGTTSLRALETLSDKSGHLTTNFKPPNTNLFIYPPYKFKFIDALITNFHLPKSTLLALVCAFVSQPNTKDKFLTFKKSLIGKAYRSAAEKKYRFYSFGDGSLIF